jgi:hypothetical protein
MSVPMLLLLTLGGYLLWFAITHWGQTNVFGPLKSLLQGKGLS